MNQYSKNMFSSIKNVLQTVALLKAYGLQHVVISPGSRNAPLAHCFNENPFFKCYSIVDERSAGYFAIGLMNKIEGPVILCCTSGTALLNYGPAVAEAFYQRLPLVVVSADRSQAWIGQMDGQTLPQPGVFGPLVEKSVNLPEIKTDEDLWYCNRLINEALIKCTRKKSPVHINVPISEPLFDFTEEKLPKVRKIQVSSANRLPDNNLLSLRWRSFGKRMILIGQMHPDKELTKILEKLTQETDCIVLCEHIANTSSPDFIGNFDALLSAIPKAEAATYAPDLLITLGGHVVSKHIREFLRNNPPQNHWHISTSGICADTFMSLTDIIEADEISFFKNLIDSAVEVIPENNMKNYSLIWEMASSSIPSPSHSLTFSDISVVGSFIRKIPDRAALYVGNSTSIRNLQLYPIPSTVEVLCNRGTNGIEGAISSASGFAFLHPELTFLLVGDLSFFYDLNGLTNKYITPKLRILLINNGGGGIFHLLSGLDKSEALEKYIAAKHSLSAEGWVKAAGLKYLQSNNNEDLERCLYEFVAEKSETAIVLEVFTTPEMNKSASSTYYHNIKIQ